MLLIGSSGVDKTHLAIAPGLAACEQGRKVRFFRVTELITLLMEAKEEKQLLWFRKLIKKSRTGAVLRRLRLRGSSISHPRPLDEPPPR